MLHGRGAVGAVWERSSSAYGQHYGRPASTNNATRQNQLGFPMNNRLSATLPPSHSRLPATPSIFTRNSDATQGDALMRAKVMRQVHPGRSPMTAPALQGQSGLGGLGGGSFGGGTLGSGSLGLDGNRSYMGGGRHAGAWAAAAI